MREQRPSNFAQIEIIHCPYSTDLPLWVTFADSIHQRPACLAKEVCHSVVRFYGLVHGELLQVVCSSAMAHTVGSDDKVGSKHGRRDFATVCATLQPCPDATEAAQPTCKGTCRLVLVSSRATHIISYAWSRSENTHHDKLNRAAEASACRFVFVRPSVFASSCKRYPLLCL